MNAQTNAQVKTLMTGILLGETPRWRDGRLWFGDWVAEKLYALDEAGNSEVMAEIASLPFSIDWLPDGRMLVVNARAMALQRQEPDGTFVTHAELGGLSEYGCNEIVVAANGNVYINNVNFNFPGGEFRPGFVALLTPDGTLTRVADGLAFPNGMAITPDGKTLIVGELFATQLTAFDIAADGSLANRRVWAKLTGGPDGICFDAEGAIWTPANASCIRVREGGEVLQTIPLDRFCFASMLGGADGKTLFMLCADWTGAIPTKDSTPTGRIYTTRVDVPHAGRP